MPYKKALNLYNMKKLFFILFTLLRRGIYVLLAFFDRMVKREQKVFILSYHSIASDGWRFSIDPHVIKKQIDYLQKHYAMITLKDLELFLAGKKTMQKPSVILTFDDGYKDILTIKDYLVTKKIRPALFILSDRERANWQELGTKRQFLNKEEIRSLIKLDWEIGCHSATHDNLSTIHKDMLEKEVVQAKKTLEKELQMPINYFAYPRGKYSPKVRTVIKAAKYSMAFTMDDGFITTQSDAYTLPRVGIDRSHTFAEFKAAFSPSVVTFRRIVKTSWIGRYL